MPAENRQAPGTAEAPRGARALISRDRLARRLQHGLDSGAVTITAGAGYGKTTLLEDAAARCAGPVAWVGCSDADRDAGVFVMRLLRAIAEAVPGASDVLAEWLTAAAERIDPSAVARALIGELSRLLVEPLTLVIEGARLREAHRPHSR